MASIALTAPDDWGFLAGSSLYGGVVNGFNAAAGLDQVNLYIGSTISTPVTGLRVGIAYDYAGISANQAGAAPLGARVPSAVDKVRPTTPMTLLSTPPIKSRRS